jgi:phosphoglycolate phosphatase
MYAKNKKGEEEHDREHVILFDLDGTLIDSTEAILESFERSFALLGGGKADEERIRDLIGYPLEEMYRRLGVEEKMIQAYVRAYKERYRNIHTRRTVLLPDAEEAVRMASDFARLGVVTTKTGRYSRELLEHFGLLGYFDVLVGSEDVLRHKPHPEPVFAALKQMNISAVSAERCWLIGDTCLDMKAASAAGISAVAVTCGYGNAEELASCAGNTEKSVLDALIRILGR